MPVPRYQKGDDNSTITRGLCDKYNTKIKDVVVAETVHDALLYKYP